MPPLLYSGIFCSYTSLILCLSILWWSFALVVSPARRNQKEGAEAGPLHITRKKPVSIVLVPVFFFCVVTVLGNGRVHGVFIRETGGLQTNRQTHVAAAGGILCFVQYHVKGETLGKSFFFTLVIY